MRRSRRVLVAVAAAGVLVGIWAAGRPVTPAAGPAVALPPSPVVARVSVPGKPRQLVRDGAGLWVVTDRGLHRIDTSTNQVVASVPVGTSTAEPGGLALSSDTVWVPGERSDLLWRVDRAANRVSGQIRLGQVLYGPVGVAVQGDSVWVTCCALKYGARPQGMLLRVDLRDRRVTSRVPVPEGPLAVVADRQALWVGTARGSLLRIDPATGKVVARVPPADARGRIQALSLWSGVLWAADTGAGAVRRLAPSAGRFDLAVVAPAPRNLAAGPDEAWVVTDLNQLLSRVDARTGRRSAPVPLPYLGGVRGIAAGQDAIWVTTGNQVSVSTPPASHTDHRPRRQRQGDRVRRRHRRTDRDVHGLGRLRDRAARPQPGLLLLGCRAVPDRAARTLGAAAVPGAAPRQAGRAAHRALGGAGGRRVPAAIGVVGGIALLAWT